MFHHKPQFWGVTSLGERGQIVVPSGAREAMKLKKGDRFIVLSKREHALVFVRADVFSRRLKGWLSKIENFKEG